MKTDLIGESCRRDRTDRAGRGAKASIQCSVFSIQSGAPRYALRNTDGFWELTFDGRTAVLKQNQALFFVAWLLANPPARPLAAHVLAAKVYEAFGTHEDFREDSVTGPWQPAAAEEAKLLRVRERALEKILDSKDELEPVKAEALRELEEVYERQQCVTARIRLCVEKSADTLKSALNELIAALAAATDGRGQPHPVVRAFALYLLAYLLMPSARASRGKGVGRFRVQEARGVEWEGNDESPQKSEARGPKSERNPKSE